MDSLSITSSPVVIKSAPVPVQAPVVQRSDVPFVPIGGGSEGFDQQIIEQQRFKTVQRLSQQVSDIYVVSDRTFTIFKDTSGQYVTRFTSLRDGKVTYVPEPNLFKMGGESDRATVQIKV